MDAAIESDLKTINDKIDFRNFTVSTSKDLNHWLVNASDPEHIEKRYFLYDRHAKTLTRTLQRVAQSQRTKTPLPNQEYMGVHVAVSYTVSDGMKQQGYVILPLGVDIGQVPLITNIHGGPHSRAHGTYDPRIQFLVNRGVCSISAKFQGIYWIWTKLYGAG